MLTATKNAVGNILFLGLILLVLVLVFSGDSIEVPESAVLRLDPSGILVEQKQPIDPLQPLLPEINQQAEETLLRDVIDAIELARDDGRIKALVLDLQSLRGGSLSQLDEIGTAIESFKETGKPVMAWENGYSQEDYYLASFADEIYLDREQSLFGGVVFEGFGHYSIYFKEALDRFRVKPHVFKAGQFKSAPEPYERNGMSEYAKEANRVFLDERWNRFLEEIATRRQLSEIALREYIDHYDELLNSPETDPGKLAENYKLVDEIISRAEWKEKLVQLTGTEADEEYSIGFSEYLSLEAPARPTVDPDSDKVAVIVAKGPILNGDQPPGTIGGDSLASLIQQAREDETTKAIVLRVDSPGGSPSASERIRSELQLTQEDGTPVVVSMGNYAASGGYWISATADKIIASPYTLTGSIGVFGMVPKFDATLAEYGVHFDGVATTELKSALHPLKPMNAQLENLIEKNIERTYRRFVTLVSDGRQLGTERVNEIAQGRIWGSQAALERDLIDEIGDLDDAIEAAAELAEIDDYDVIYVEEPLSPRDQLIADLLENVLLKVSALLPGIGASLPTLPPEFNAIIDMLNQGTEPKVLALCAECESRF